MRTSIKGFINDGAVKIEEINEILNSEDKEYIFASYHVCNAGYSVDLVALNDFPDYEDDWNGYDYIMMTDQFYNELEQFGKIMEMDGKSFFVPFLEV